MKVHKQTLGHLNNGVQKRLWASQNGYLIFTILERVAYFQKIIINILTFLECLSVVRNAIARRLHSSIN